MPEIHLVQVGKLQPDVVDFLTLSLEDILGLRCRPLGISLDPTRAYSPARQQYNSMDLLLEMSRLESRPGVKLLGLTGVDLFIPILTFVFGQAQLGNRLAIMSTRRLEQGFYGLPEDEDVFYRRCEKEAVHELGHTFGLVHCTRYECVMHFSNSIEEVDLKESGFCEDCEAIYRAAVGAVKV